MMQESGQILKVGFSENLILQLCEMFQVSQYFTLRNIFRLIIKENLPSMSFVLLWHFSKLSLDLRILNYT